MFVNIFTLFYNGFWRRCSRFANFWRFYWLNLCPLEIEGKRLACDGGIVSLVASGSGSSGAWMKQVRTSTEKDMAARNVCSLREWHVLQKVFRTCSILYILTWKCASRHSGVQFFHIWTWKSGPRPSVSYDFDLKMCFSPQRRAIFPHLNLKKWSETVSFLRFWLENVLLATAACNFSTSLLPKVVRTCAQCMQLERVAFYLKMCFALQRRASLHVFSQQPPPRPPLYRGYFSTQPTHKSPLSHPNTLKVSLLCHPVPSVHVSPVLTPNPPLSQPQNLNCWLSYLKP